MPFQRDGGAEAVSATPPRDPPPTVGAGSAAPEQLNPLSRESLGWDASRVGRGWEAGPADPVRMVHSHHRTQT